MLSKTSVSVGVPPSASAWIRLANAVKAAIFVSLSADAADVGYDVDYTPDDPECFTDVSVGAPSGGVFPVTTLRPHGLSPGDSAIPRKGRIALPVQDVPTPTTFTVPTAPPADTFEMALLRVFPEPDLINQSTAKFEATPSLAFAVRVNVKTLTVGEVTLSVLTPET